MLLCPCVHRILHAVQQVCHGVRKQLRCSIRYALDCFLHSLQRGSYCPDRQCQQAHVDQRQKPVDVHIVKVKEFLHCRKTCFAGVRHVVKRSLHTACKFLHSRARFLRQAHHGVPYLFQRLKVLVLEVTNILARILKCAECLADQRRHAVKGHKEYAAQQLHRAAQRSADADAFQPKVLEYGAHRVHNVAKGLELPLSLLHRAAVDQRLQQPENILHRLQKCAKSHRQRIDYIVDALGTLKALVQGSENIAKGCPCPQKQVAQRLQYIHQLADQCKCNASCHQDGLSTNAQHAEQPLEQLRQAFHRAFVQHQLACQVVKPLQQTVQRAAVRVKHFVKSVPDGPQHAVDALQDVQDAVEKVLPSAHFPHLGGITVKAHFAILNCLGHFPVGVDRLIQGLPAHALCGQFFVALLRDLFVSCKTELHPLVQIICGHSRILQRLLKAACVLDLLLCQLAVGDQAAPQLLRECIAHVSQRRIVQKLVHAAIKGLLQPAVASTHAACKNIPELLCQVTPEGLCLLVIAKQNVKGFHPARAYSVLGSVNDLAETLGLLRGFKGLHGHFIVLVGKRFNGKRSLIVVLRVCIQFRFHRLSKFSILAKGLFHYLTVGPLLL